MASKRLGVLTRQLVSQQLASATASSGELQMVRWEKRDRVYIVYLNRPKALNALCNQLHEDVAEALSVARRDAECGCVIITGSGRAFAAGADIKEMAGMSLSENVNDEFPTPVWQSIDKFDLPVVAAVNGLALGGGCELAMMCDIIVASEQAVFGQPEIKLGVIPGAGGTQRLTRIVGKSKSMELNLTGDNLSAQEAKAYNLVSAVVPSEELMDYTLVLANRIAANSRPATMLVKEAVKAAYETNLNAGLRFERKVFQTTFGLKDKFEGMKAFVEKRKPKWNHN